MKKSVIVTITLLTLVLALRVMAAPGDAQSTTGATGQYVPTGANSVTTEGGNVTEVNVSAIISTGNWQGFYGNVSGSLRLGDGSSTFYDWTGIGFSAVYASPDNNLDWTTVNGISSTASKEGKDTDYGFNSEDSDSINKTMTGSGCSAGTEIAAAAGVTPFNSGGGAGSWTTCLAEDGGGAVSDTVLGTNIIEAGGDAYNGATVQYQLMVPVDSPGQLYYFYLEI